MKSQWYGIGALTVVVLLSTGLAWGQNTPCTWTTVSTTNGNYYLPKEGTGTGNPIPQNMKPYSNIGGQYAELGNAPYPGGNYYTRGDIYGNNGGTVPGGICWSNSNGSGGCGLASSTRILVQRDLAFCGGSACYSIYQVTWYTYSDSAKDYDVDSLMNNVDPYQWAYKDSDGDGIIDALDPWPNDNTKPGSTKFIKKFTYTRKSDGATITVYAKESDPENQDWWFYVKSTTGISIDDVTPEGWRTDVQIGGKGKTYSEWNFSTGGVAGGTSRGSATQAGGVQTETGRASGGDSGTRDPSQGSSADYQIMFDYLSGIQRNTSDQVKNLKEIIAQNENIQKNQVTQAQLLDKIANKDIEVNMGGVESRIDTSNEKLESIKGKLDDIKNGLLEVGDVGDLQDGDTSAMEDNSDLTESENEAKYNQSKDLLEGFLDDIFYSNNPVKNIITNSYVNDSGGVSSLAVNAGVFSFSLNFAGMESQLGLLGTFFVSFCGLAGLIEFIRG